MQSAFDRDCVGIGVDWLRRRLGRDIPGVLRIGDPALDGEIGVRKESIEALRPGCRGSAIYGSGYGYRSGCCGFARTAFRFSKRDITQGSVEFRMGIVAPEVFHRALQCDFTAEQV